MWREARLDDPDGNHLCLFRAGPNRLHPPWRVNESRTNTEIRAATAAQGQLDAYNARDIDAFLPWLSDACEARDLATGEVVIPAGAAFRERYAELFGSHPLQRADLLGRIVLDRFVVDCEHTYGYGDGRAPRRVVAIYETADDGTIKRVWFLSV